MRLSRKDSHKARHHRYREMTRVIKLLEVAANRCDYNGDFDWLLNSRDKEQFDMIHAVISAKL